MLDMDEDEVVSDVTWVEIPGVGGRVWFVFSDGSLAEADAVYTHILAGDYASWEPGVSAMQR